MSTTKKPTLTEITAATIKDWKLHYGAVYVFASEDTLKKGYFKRPDRVTMDAVSSLAATNPVRSNEMLAKDCFLGGDEELITEDKYFFGLSRKLKDLVPIVQGELTEL